VFASTLPSRRALARPIRRSRFGGIEGRQATRGGDSPQGFPLEASEARSAAGAKAQATVLKVKPRKRAGSIQLKAFCR